MLQEGTANYFKGLMLVLCYLIVGASFFVHRDSLDPHSGIWNLGTGGLYGCNYQRLWRWACKELAHVSGPQKPLLSVTPIFSQPLACSVPYRLMSVHLEANCIFGFYRGNFLFRIFLVCSSVSFFSWGLLWPLMVLMHTFAPRIQKMKYLHFIHELDLCDRFCNLFHYSSHVWIGRYFYV